QYRTFGQAEGPGCRSQGVGTVRAACAPPCPGRKEPVLTLARRPELPSHAQVRRMFQRTLAGWTMDLLALRRAGLDHPGLRRGGCPAVMPARTDQARPTGPARSRAA